MELEPQGIPGLIQHNGWTIYAWTGWRGTKSIAMVATAAGCPICGNGFNEGDVIKLEQSRRPSHWLCAHPDNAPDRLMGQWLATKGEGLGARFMEVNVDNLVAYYIDGGEYKRGASFPVSAEGEFITENTPDDVREVARQIGLCRLKYLIDQ